jgi:hypothetical protein
MEGIETKLAGLQRSALMSGLLTAAALTITNSSLDNVLVESFEFTGCPLRITLSTIPACR